MPLVNKDNFISGIKLNSVAQGTALALGLSIVFSVALGLVYHLGPITEHAVPWIAAGILAVSSFLGSAVAGRNAGSMGIYHGIVVGIAFFVVIWLLGGLFFAGMSAVGALIKLLIAAVTGALGGILGVGLA